MPRQTLRALALPGCAAHVGCGWDRSCWGDRPWPNGPHSATILGIFLWMILGIFYGDVEYQNADIIWDIQLTSTNQEYDVCGCVKLGDTPRVLL